MDQTAYRMHDRPTKAGLYFVYVQLPFRVSLLDFKAQEDRFVLPEDPDIQAGVLVWDDAGAEKLLPYEAAKAHVEKGADIPSVRWVKKIAALGKDGIVDSYAYYLYIEKDLPSLPGLQGAERTDFDKDGNLLYEVDPQGRRITGAQLARHSGTLGAWQAEHYVAGVAIGALAIGAGVLLWKFWAAGLILTKLAILWAALLGVSATTGIYFVKVSANKDKSKGFLEKAKENFLYGVKQVTSGLKTAAQWTVGILGLVAVVKVLDVID